MQCPECGHTESKVVDSRDSSDSVRRRRLCLHCSGRFTTYERVSNFRLKVLKRNGKEEAFSVEKLTRSIELACAKRSLPLGTSAQIVEEIHEDAINEGRERIETSVIGEMVLKRLKSLDNVAYLRFASVFIDFENPERFAEEASILEMDDPAGSADLQSTFMAIPGAAPGRSSTRRN